MKPKEADGYFCHSRFCLRDEKKDSEAMLVVGGYVTEQGNHLYEYDPENGEQLHETPRAFAADVLTTISTNGQLLAQCFDDRFVSVTSTADASIYCSIDINEFENTFISMRFSPNNQMIVFLLEDAYMIYQIEREAAKRLCFASHYESLSFFAFSDRLMVWNELGIYFALSNRILFVNSANDYQFYQSIAVEDTHGGLDDYAKPQYLDVSADGNTMLLIYGDYRFSGCKVLNRVSHLTYNVTGQWKSVTALTATLIDNQFVVLLRSSGFSIFNLKTMTILHEYNIKMKCKEISKLQYLDHTLMLENGNELIFYDIEGECCDHLWFESGSLSHADYQSILLSRMQFSTFQTANIAIFFFSQTLLRLQIVPAKSSTCQNQH